MSDVDDFIDDNSIPPLQVDSAPPQFNASENAGNLLMSQIYALVPETSEELLYAITSSVIDIVNKDSIDPVTQKLEIENTLNFQGKLSTTEFQKLVELAHGLNTEFLIVDEDLPIAEDLDKEDTEPQSSLNFVPLDKSKRVKSYSVVLPSEIDSNWLFAKLKENDIPTSTEHILDILSMNSDLEIPLTEALGVDNVDLISLLANNSKVIYWYTKLANAADSETREEIYDEIIRNKLTVEDINRDQSEMAIDIPDEIDLEFVGRPVSAPLSVKIKLPEGSTKKTARSYDRYDIPSPKLIDHDPSTFRSVQSLPEWAQSAFSFNKLNYIQSLLSEKLLECDGNVLLSAPTGAGKTTIALMAILRCLHLGKTAVYLAPMKALAQEITNLLQKVLPDYQVGEITGDVTVTKSELSSLDVMVATPEKWDIITRKPTNYEILYSLGLLIVDEIHLLHDEDRGGVLEGLIIRHQTRPNLRIVGLSATMPNYKDIAQFIKATDDLTFYFDSAYRPVPLNHSFIGITEKNILKERKASDEIVKELIDHYQTLGKQVIVFVQSRRGTQITKDYLVENTTLSEPQIGIHHAGLSRDFRNQVENDFREGKISVLVSTSTLAWGVNLPASAVIIKDTQFYDSQTESWKQLSALDMLQMLGRAGRPGFDTSGDGITITTQKYLNYFVSISTNTLPIESHLMNKVSDCINAEVVLHNIRNLSDAEKWLESSFWYIRSTKTPRTYGQVDLKSLAHSVLMQLSRHGSLAYDFPGLKPKVEGEISSFFYIFPSTVRWFLENLQPNMDHMDLIKIFARADEFKNIKIRKGEMGEISRISTLVPIPLKDQLESRYAKIEILLQAYISRLELTGLTLTTDMAYIAQSASRLFRAIFQLCLLNSWAKTAWYAHSLYLMTVMRIWEYGQSPLRQFNDAPGNVITRLERSLISFPRLRTLNAEDLDVALKLGSAKPASASIDMLKRIPLFDLSGNCKPVSSNCLELTIDFRPQFELSDYNMNSDNFLLIIEDLGGCIIHESFIRLRSVLKEPSKRYFFVADDTLPPFLYARISSDKWLHGTSEVSIDLRNLEFPKPSIQSSELDMEDDDNQVGLNLAKNPDESYVNKVMFSLLAESNRNVVLGMPSASNPLKSLEFATQAVPGKTLVITPRSANWINNVKPMFNNNTCFQNCIDAERVSRLPQELHSLVNDVDLVLLHDTHEIGSPNGWKYEVLVTRLLSLVPDVRIVAVGNPISSAKCLGKWLKCKKYDIANFLLTPGITGPTAELNRWCGSVSTHIKGELIDQTKLTVFIAHEHQFPELKHSLATKGIKYSVHSSGNCSAVITTPSRFLNSNIVPDYLYLFDGGEPGYDTNLLELNKLFALFTKSKLKSVGYINDFDLFSDLLDSPMPLESNLLANFAEALVPEIANEVVKTPQDAIVWLSKTFLYLRMQTNTSYYDSQDFTDTVSELVESAFEYLASVEVIDYNEDLLTVKPLLRAHIICQHGVSITDLISTAPVDYKPTVDRFRLVNILEGRIDLAYSTNNLNLMLDSILELQHLVQCTPLGSSSLLQIPHLDMAALSRCEDSNTLTVNDFSAIEDDEFRTYLLGFDNEDPRMLEVAEFVNNYPIVDILGVTINEGCLEIEIERDIEEDCAPEVVARGIPELQMQEFNEKWFLIVTDSQSSILGFQTLELGNPVNKISLKLLNPPKTEFRVLLLCNSYLGADKEYNHSSSVC